MKYDVIILGSGAAGYYSALSCAEKGMRTALVEGEELGGTAFRWGSLAVKRVLDSFREVDEEMTGELGGDLRRIYRKRYRRAVETLSEVEKRIERRLRGAGVEIIQGRGRIERGEKDTLRVYAGKWSGESERIILATGTRGDTRWPGEGIVTHRELLAMTELPERICIVGGSVEGIELANITSYMGIETTVIEGEDEILKGTMRAQAEPVVENLRRRGARFVTGRMVEGCRGDKDSVEVAIDDGSRISSDLVVVTGVRKPSIPEGVSLKLSDGWVDTDERYETSLKGVYAVGDINGIMGMANAARYQGEQMGDILTGQRQGEAYPKSLSRAIYTIPEIAAAGSPGKYSGTGYFRDTFRGWSKGVEDGFVRVEADDEGRICGIFMSGRDVSEYLGPLGYLVDKRVSLEEAGRIMMAHPTMMEAFHDAVEAVRSQVKGDL